MISGFLILIIGLCFLTFVNSREQNEHSKFLNLNDSKVAMVIKTKAVFVVVISKSPGVSEEVIEKTRDDSYRPH